MKIKATAPTRTIEDVERVRKIELTAETADEQILLRELYELARDEKLAKHLGLEER